MKHVTFSKKLVVSGGILLLLITFRLASNSYAQQAVKQQVIKKEVKRLRDNLTIKIVSCPKKDVKAGENLGTSFQVIGRSTFASTLKDITVDIILTSNPTYPVPAPYAVYSPNYLNNVLLKGGREHISFKGSGTVNVKLNGLNTIPGDTPAGNYFLGAVIDAGNKIKELDEKDNVYFCKLRVGGTESCCALPFTEWDGFTYGVEFVAAHSGIAVISAGNAASDPRAADVQITIDTDNTGTDIRTYRDYTGHTVTPDKYWSTVTVPFKKGDGVTITPNRYTTVHARVYYFAD